MTYISISKIDKFNEVIKIDCLVVYEKRNCQQVYYLLNITIISTSKKITTYSISIFTNSLAQVKAVINQLESMLRWGTMHLRGGGYFYVVHPNWNNKGGRMQVMSTRSSRSTGPPLLHGISLHFSISMVRLKVRLEKACKRFLSNNAIHVSPSDLHQLYSFM